MDLSHENCLAILANPSTQTILEKLGYEYSDRGHAEYRKARPNIVPPLVLAIVKELERHPAFPPEYRDLPKMGLYVRKEGDNVVLVDTVEPSALRAGAFPFATPDGAARAYVRMVLEPYWLQLDDHNHNVIRQQVIRRRANPEKP